MSQRSSLTDDAVALGHQRGRDAAAWVFNGTTSAASQHGAHMLIDAGSKPFRSDGPVSEETGADLSTYAGIAPRGEDSGNAAAAYQEAASEAFWDELERLCHAYLADAG